jgi:hypothetical protein
MWKMKVFLLLIITSFTFCNSKKQDIPKDLSTLSYDTAVIAIIPFQGKDFYGGLDSSNKPSELTQKDISEIEKIFMRSIAEHELALLGREKDPHSIKNELIYKRQYICYITKKGEKIVYVNCFCGSMNIDWHKQMMIVQDGGNCFFNLKINLSTQKYFDFMVNGYA